MRTFMGRLGWALLAVLFIVTGLGFGVVSFWQATHQNSDQSQAQTQADGGIKFLKNFKPTASIPKLKVVDIKKGKGKEVKAGDTLEVKYVAAVASTGVIFDDTVGTNKPAAVGLKETIKGWSQGLPGMREGGKRRLLIPAELAYGANPPPGSSIPVNADLVFDVTLISIK